eukprot:632684-Pelagomonas_calceolata.AAC.7
MRQELHGHWAIKDKKLLRALPTTDTERLQSGLECNLHDKRAMRALTHLGLRLQHIEVVRHHLCQGDVEYQAKADTASQTKAGAGTKQEAAAAAAAAAAAGQCSCMTLGTGGSKGVLQHVALPLQGSCLPKLAKAQCVGTEQSRCKGVCVLACAPPFRLLSATDDCLSDQPDPFMKFQPGIHHLFVSMFCTGSSPLLEVASSMRLPT